jgi:hypothetical protein
MLPKAHIIFGAFLTLLLHFAFPGVSLFYLAIVLLSSVLIDGDHYFYYIFKTGNLNPIKAIKWHKEHMKKTFSLSMNERKKIYTGFYFLHGIEWIIIFALLGRFVFPVLTYVSIGFLFHFAIDIPAEFYSKRTIHKSSLIYMAILLLKERKNKQ